MTNETFHKMWNILKENEFQIDIAINSEIICTSCKRVLIKPCNVPCGCRYCYDCLIRYLNAEEKFCSGQSDYCKSELINIDSNVFIDQPANIKISRIVVKCPFESCEISTELGKMADHMRTCDRLPVKCPYYLIGCEENKIGVKLHFKQENYYHAKLLMEFLDNWKKEVKLLKVKMMDLQEENKWIKSQMESKQEKMSALEENVRKLLEENRSLKELETEKIHENNQLKSLNKEEMEKNKKKFEEVEMNQEQMRTRIEEIGLENRSFRDTMKLENKTKEETISALQSKLKKIEEEFKKEKEKRELLEKIQEQMKMSMKKISDENVIMATKYKENEKAMKMFQEQMRTRIEGISQENRSLRKQLDIIKLDNKTKEVKYL